MNDSSDIIIDDYVITENELKEIHEKIINCDAFPFYKHTATKDIGIMVHVFTTRNSKEIFNEEYYQFFLNILIRFCDKNNIPIERVYRSGINLGSENSTHKQTHPHVDLLVDETYKKNGYKIALIYLNDVSCDPGYNSTIVYKERAPTNNYETTVLDMKDIKNLNVEREILPKKGRIVCFDGSRYHANYFSKGNEYRYVVVFNFI